MRKLPVFECLIISPSDVGADRRAVVEEITRWNGTSGRSIGAIVAPVMWEAHSRPTQSSAAQDAINEQLVDDCDFGIAVFWSKLGTPTAKAPSGSAEEIERLISQGKEVLVYFSKAPIPQPIDTTELARLDDYRKKLTGLRGAFASPEELRGLVHGALTPLVTGLLAREIAPGPQERGAEKEDRPETKSEPERLLRPAIGHVVTVHWFAYKDNYLRDKFTKQDLLARDVDGIGRVVVLTNGPREVRVPLDAVQSVWSDQPGHWAIRISGKLDLNSYTYSP